MTTGQFGERLLTEKSHSLPLLTIPTTHPPRPDLYPDDKQGHAELFPGIHDIHHGTNYFGNLLTMSTRGDSSRLPSRPDTTSELPDQVYECEVLAIIPFQVLAIFQDTANSLQSSQTSTGTSYLPR